MFRKIGLKKLCLISLSIVLALSLFFATDISKAADEKDEFLIVSVEKLTNSQLNQSVSAYSEKKPVLPSVLTCKVETGDTVKVPVVWKSNKTYVTNVLTTYKFTPSVDKAYTVAQSVVLPTINSKVVKCTTKITEIATQRTNTARYTATDIVKIYNGYGKTLKLQMWKNGQWVTKKTYTLKDKSYQELKVYFPNDWWKVTTSYWRMYIGSGKCTTSFASYDIKLKTKRYYQNPSKYIQIQDKITIDNSGGYTLKSGYMGLKTRQVNRYFGIGDKYWPRYSSTTKSKVKAFQKRKGLDVTGNVNLATWKKMGYSESSWYNMGAYVSPIKVNPSSYKSDHIEAMIDRAYDYLGSDYVVGASGTPSQGADCSGLVMQALYAAGIEMPGINPVTHSWAGHEYESRNIWEKNIFKKINYSDRKRGDLIFYKNSKGVVNHVAIYLGNGKVIESWPNKVRVAKVNHHSIKGVMRVFV